MPISYTVKIVVDGQTSSILTTPDQTKATTFARSLTNNAFISRVVVDKHTSITESTEEKS